MGQFDILRFWRKLTKREQLEEEAKAIELRLVPHTREEKMEDFVYAEAETLHRWIKRHLSQIKSDEKKAEALDHLVENHVATRMADHLVAETIAHLAAYLDGRKLSGSLEWSLRGYLSAKNIDKNFGFEYLSETLAAHATDGVEHRIDLDEKNALTRDERVG